MITLVLVLPLVLLLAAPVSRGVGTERFCSVSIGVSLAQFLAGGLLFWDCVVMQSVSVFSVFEFISIRGYVFEIVLMADRLSAAMLVVVGTVSACVQLYSASYMSDDPHRVRFSLYLHLFSFFMFILVTSPNYLQLFVGWEGVGIMSYLLVNFWYTRSQANKSSLKALFVNRVGDYFYLIALFGLLTYYGSTDFSASGAVANGSRHLDFIVLVFCVAAFAKSAQFGLHTWLPDAMEGPTPVSALIHAATMVTAGVFLLLRAEVLIYISDASRVLLQGVGAVTAVFAASVGTCQYDLKKVIAYSTCSQLGYMMAAIGSGEFGLCFFHLLNHAFFKALLFLTAGVIIHALNNEQDMRRYGGVIRLLPYSYVTFLVASAALVGFPFFSGFYSKEAIVTSSYTSSGMTFSNLFLSIAAAFTAYYSMRTIHLVFAGTPRFNLADSSHLHDVDKRFFLATAPLFALTVTSGYIFKDLMVGPASTVMSVVRVGVSPLEVGEFDLDMFEKSLPLIFTFWGGWLANAWFARNNPPMLAWDWWVRFHDMFRFLVRRWWVDLLDGYLVRSVLLASYDFFLAAERGYNNYLGSFGAAITVLRLGRNLRFSFSETSVYGTFLLIFISLLVIMSLTTLEINSLPILFGYATLHLHNKQN